MKQHYKIVLMILMSVIITTVAWAQPTQPTQTSQVSTSFVTPFVDSSLVIETAIVCPELTIAEERMKIPFKEPSFSNEALNVKTRAEESTKYPVQIQVKGLSEECKVKRIAYLNSNSQVYLKPRIEGDIITASIPEGTNDIIIAFSNLLVIKDSEGNAVTAVNEGNSYYIIEDVEVGQNTPLLYADAAECRTIPMEFCLADGSAIEFATQKWEDKEFVEVSSGNLIYALNNFCFYNSKYGINEDKMVDIFQQPFNVEGYDNTALKFWETKVNQVSDNWVFTNNIVYLDNKLNFCCVGLVYAANTESNTIQKDDLKLSEWNFNPNSSFELVGIESSSSIDSSNWYESLYGTGVTLKIDRPMNIYVANIDYRGGNNTPSWNLDFSYSIGTPAQGGKSKPDLITAPKRLFKGEMGGYIPSTDLLAIKPFETSYQYYDEANWGVPEFNYSEKQLGMKFNNSAPFVVSCIN